MRNKIVDVAIASTVIAVATIGLLVLFGVLHFEPADDDRPPVVVSSGSIEVEAESNKPPGTRGKFEKVDANGKEWKVAHDSGATPRYLLAVITNSTSNTEACRATSLFTNVTSMIFTYSWEKTPTGSRNLTASIHGHGLQLTFDDAVPDPNVDYELSLGATEGNEATLESVTIGTVRCNLGSRSRVRIYQRKDRY